MKEITVENENCESVYKNIYNVLNKILEIWKKYVDSEGNLKNDIKHDENYLDYLNILLNSLYEYTNIKEVISDSKIDIDIYNLDLELFNNFCKSFEIYSNEYKCLFKDFAYEKEYKMCDFLFEKLTNYLYHFDVHEFTYLIPLNIFFNESDFLDLHEVVKFFNFELIIQEEITDIINSKSKHTLNDIKSVNLDNFKNDILKILNYHEVVLYFKYNARSFKFARNELLLNLNSFLGFLSFSKLYYQVNYYSDFNMNDYSLIKYNYNLLIEMKENTFILPFDFSIKNFENFEKIYIKNEDFPIFQTRFNNLKNIKNTKLQKLIKNSFYKYYLAATEKDLSYSFFMYWVLIEDTIKFFDAKTETELNQIIKSYLKDDKILQKRVDYLQYSRNYFVHKSKSADQNDRRLVKKIADKLLIDTLEIISNFDSDDEYSLYLIYKNKSKPKRKKLMDVLKLLDNNNNLS